MQGDGLPGCRKRRRAQLLWCSTCGGKRHPHRLPVSAAALLQAFMHIHALAATRPTPTFCSACCRCTFSKEPCKADATLAAVLDRLAELTVRQLEAPWALKHPHLPNRQRGMAAYHTATLLVDASQHHWKLLHLNPSAVHRTGEAPAPFCPYPRLVPKYSGMRSAHVVPCCISIAMRSLFSAALGACVRRS